MPLDPTAPELLYEQLAAALRQRIASGDLPPRTAIPSVLTLVEEYGVANGTVRKALTILTEEGLVHSVPGKGTFVREARG